MTIVALIFRLLAPITQFMEAVSFLKDEFISRREKNPSYSLRAFARDLGISHTYLSLVFSGKRNLSPSQTAQIAMLLGHNALDIEKWIQNSATNKALKKQVKQGKSKKPKFQDLQIEYEKVLAGWYYLPILEATYLKDAVNDPLWFAKRLGISSVEARDAIERLLQLEMLEIKNGKLKKTKDFLSLPATRSMASLRAYHHAIFEKAREALTDTLDEAFKARQISGGTLAIQKSKINQAKARLKQLQDEFIAEFATADSDEVYQFSLQFFPLTKSKEKAQKNEK